MLDMSILLDLIRTYGYTSTTNHPYVYKKGDTLGICYTYHDEIYGDLERVRFFESKDELEDFIKRYAWFKENGLRYNVRMALDNYELVNPKVLFIRNNKLMVKGEMFNIEEFDIIEAKKPSMDLASRLILEAGNLLLIYDETKSRQLEYLKSFSSLKNIIRSKYCDLQKEIDIYNSFEIKREAELLPETVDLSGIDENSEKVIKDRYNQYRIRPPEIDEAAVFVNDVWNLNLAIEINRNYYETQVEENDLRNELRAVNKKLDYIMKLNDNVSALFKKDLNKGFAAIDKVVANSTVSIPKNYVQDKINDIEKKYSHLDKLSIYHLADYLKEAMNNTNYDDLVKKYPKDSKDDIVINKKPINEIAADLFVQYRDKLTPNEQALLILYNSKYREYFEALWKIKDIDTLSVKNIIKKLNSIKGFSKIKSECFDSVKARVNDPVNSTIKQQLFFDIDFTDYKTFVKSFVNLSNKLKQMEYKLFLADDIIMYYKAPISYRIYDEKLRLVTNDLNGIINDMNVKKDVIGVVDLKKGTPLLYSPYVLDFGDIYSKDKEPNLAMNIKEMVNFDLLVNLSNLDINKETNNVKVARYYSDPVPFEDINIVDEISLLDTITFDRLTFNVKEDANQPVLENNTAQIDKNEKEENSNVEVVH